MEKYIEENDLGIKTVLLKEFTKELERIINMYKISIFDVFSKEENEEES